MTITDDIMPSEYFPPRTRTAAKHYITIHVTAEWDGVSQPRLMEPGKCIGWFWRSYSQLAALPMFLSMSNLLLKAEKRYRR